MTGKKKRKSISPAVLRAIAVANRRLTRRELELALAIPISEEERKDTLELVKWFTRRYPTAGDRLAYIRKAYARWRASVIEQ
jgi:hypothetical protein